MSRVKVFAAEIAMIAAGTSAPMAVEIPANQEPGDPPSEPAASEAPLVEVGEGGPPPPAGGEEADDRDEGEQAGDDAEFEPVERRLHDGGHRCLLVAR